MNPFLIASALSALQPLVPQIVTFLQTHGNTASSDALGKAVLALIQTQIHQFVNANVGTDLTKVAGVISDIVKSVQLKNGMSVTGLIDALDAVLLGNVHGNATPPVVANGNPVNDPNPGGQVIDQTKEVPLFYFVTKSVQHVLDSFRPPTPSATVSELIISNAIDAWKPGFSPDMIIRNQQVDDVASANLIVLLSGDSEDDGKLNDPSLQIIGFTDVGGPNRMTNGNDPLRLRLNGLVTWHPQLFGDTVAHELGHAMGLDKHTDEVGIDDPNSVINQVVTTIGKPDTTDFNRMRAVWNLPARP